MASSVAERLSLVSNAHSERAARPAKVAQEGLYASLQSTFGPGCPERTGVCSDDCEPTSAVKGRLINGSIDSPLEPQPALSLHDQKLIKSANRNTVESNMQRNRTSNKSNKTMKEKTKLDVSDLLIESRLGGSNVLAVFPANLVLSAMIPSKIPLVVGFRSLRASLCYILHSDICL